MNAFSVQYSDVQCFSYPSSCSTFHTYFDSGAYVRTCVYVNAVFFLLRNGVSRELLVLFKYFCKCIGTRLFERHRSALSLAFYSFCASFLFGVVPDSMAGALRCVSS